MQVKYIYICVCIRAFHFTLFMQFRLALCVSWLDYRIQATTKKLNVLVYVEDPVTGNDVLGGKLR